MGDGIKSKVYTEHGRKEHERIFGGSEIIRKITEAIIKYDGSEEAMREIKELTEPFIVQNHEQMK